MGNLSKTTYTDHQTVITANNLNAIQDAIIQNTSYGTCSTAASTAAKTVALSDFVLTTGACIRVKFTNTNTAANPTLNVNGTGAKSIMRFGTTAIRGTAATSWNSGSIVTFVYDGTNWLMCDYTNTSYLGIGDFISNEWDNSNDILLISPAFNGGNYRVYCTSSSYPVNMPSVLQGVTAVLYRVQYAYNAGTLAHAVVILHEVSPVHGRVWINIYNQTWRGWVQHNPGSISRIYGKILGSAATGATAEGYGHATVTEQSDGRFRIDFCASVTTADSTATTDYSFGLRSDLISALVGKTITPLAGGHYIPILNSNGMIDKTAMGYGSLLQSASNGKCWAFARMYQTDGSVGAWATSRWNVGDMFYGTCYGQ